MILDTNAVSALALEDAGIIKVLAASERHHLPVIVIGEYGFGLAGLRRGRELQKWLELLVSENIILSVELATATHYARLRTELQRAGTPIPANDLWIAALAREHGLPIVSRDAHFDHVRGIQRLGW
jgi:predicted nucleic acid-binding protein